jgi:hypothetical protein
MALYAQLHLNVREGNCCWPLLGDVLPTPDLCLFQRIENFQSHQRSQKFRHGAARGQVARFKELRSLFNLHREPPSFGLAFSPSSHPPSITLIALSHLASVRKACPRLRRGLLSCAVMPSRNISAMKRRTTSVTTVPEAISYQTPNAPEPSLYRRRFRCSFRGSIIS